ncbi:30S ribosomal protein S18 [Wolbachia endosymbiont of Pentidionis agamae]|uniref:30S ribosomal protein S18 n=1 Tax=Wolbachia endosymbiont of Pentidionis agamae TaxID=3110435 RepID=UPI002FD37684
MKSKISSTKRKNNKGVFGLYSNNRSIFRHTKVCALISHSKDDIDYKNKSLLSKFTSDYGRILPKRLTGVCAKKQRMLAKAIKRARYLALLSYCTEKI